MKKIDSHQLCGKFNSIRINNQKRTFLISEMADLLAKNGISNWLFTKMNSANTFFYRARKGRQVYLSFTTSPIYEAQFTTLLRSKKATPHYKFSEQEAITFLKKQGYRIFKERGIDEEKLKEENPEIYEKYMKVTEI